MIEFDNNISISVGDATVARDIESSLLHSLRSTLPQSHNADLVLVARNRQGTMAGGLTASSSYGWLLIKTLWVGAPYRRQGLGRALVERAHQEGLAINCHSAWLDTANPTARQFYLDLGYEVFGELANTSVQLPASHRRWFMRSALPGK